MMSAKPCYRMALAYDGTDFVGWQMQPNGVSIQQLVQKALSAVLQEPIHVLGSGRTDAGVHALEQMAHFHTWADVDLFKVQRALNGTLPPTIRLLRLERALPGFHARYSACGKIYRYHITTAAVESPFHRLYRWHVRYPLDLSALCAAAQIFIGTHDFTSFANEPQAGSVARNPVRTLYRLDCIKEPKGFYLEFAGNGFLYKMVRNIVGCLVDVARGKTSIDELHAILQAKDRRQAGPAAPARGLFLACVLYPEEKQ